MTLVVSCDTPDPSDDCTKACSDALAPCGLLPSSLGSDPAECAARCSRSSPDVQARVLSSDDGLGDLDICTESASCAVVASRLLESFGDSGVVGSGDIVFDPDKFCTATGLLDDDRRSPCSPKDARTCEGQGLQTLCGTYGATDVEFVVDHDSAGLRARGKSCGEAFTEGELFADLPPGRARTWVRVRGFLGGASYCRTFVPPSLVALRSGQTATVDAITIGSKPRKKEEVDAACVNGVCLGGFDCEEGETMCVDGVDNDGNGRRDALEPACAGYQPEGEVD